MRKALVPAFLLVLGAVILGATVFREQLVHAATTPFQNVVVTNTPTNPVNVQQQGTADVNVTNSTVPVHEQGTATVTGTVGLDPAGNTVNLGTTDRGRLDTANAHLAAIDAATGQLSFDGSGNLKTAPQGTQTVHIDNTSLPVSGPAPMQTLYENDGFTVSNDNSPHTVDSVGQTVYADYIEVGGLTGDQQVFFYDGSTPELVLLGSVNKGQDTYVLTPTHPVAFDSIQAVCANASDCQIGMSISGTTSP
jgi:hypothetical protein